MNEDTGKLFEPTMSLRWLDKCPILSFVEGSYDSKVLQQAFVCKEDGQVMWQDIPTVVDKNEA